MFFNTYGCCEGTNALRRPIGKTYPGSSRIQESIRGAFARPPGKGNTPAAAADKFE